MRKSTVSVFVFLCVLVTSVAADPLLTFAVNKGDSGVPDLYLYLLDVGSGGEPVDITPLGAKSASAVWSPDGSHLLFSSLLNGDPGLNYDLYSMDRNGGNLQRLTETPDIEFDPAWSPDGRKVAYFIGNPIENNRSLWVLDLNSGVKRELVPPGGEVAIGVTRAVWSPDGRRIAFNAIGAANKAGLYAVQVDTKQITPIHEGLFFMTVQGWLPTGELLVRESGGSKLGLLSLSGVFEVLFPGVQERLQIQNTRATWRRPDLLVFTASPIGRPSVWDIYRVKRDGSGLRQLTNDGEAVQEYSPDLWYDALGVLPVSKLTTTWGAMKGDKIH